MQIMMSSTEALQIIDRSYAGGSKPISINRRAADAQSPDWWRTRGKTETVEQARKRAALDLYLHIASRAADELPPDVFPAAFLFSDKARYRPDKGLIKALLQIGAIEAQEINGELCFVLTASGQNNFRNRA
jgi:hypothetical protein